METSLGETHNGVIAACCRQCWWSSHASNNLKTESTQITKLGEKLPTSCVTWVPIYRLRSRSPGRRMLEGKIFHFPCLATNLNETRCEYSQKSRHKSVRDIFCSGMPRVARFTNPNRKVWIFWARERLLNYIDCVSKILEISRIQILLVGSILTIEVVTATK